jgi:putative FmdB family regulatory protein
MRGADMPIFEYTCEKCAYKFERVVLHAGSEVKCPMCQSPVQKLYSSFAVGHSPNAAADLPDSFGPKMCKNC